MTRRPARVNARRDGSVRRRSSARGLRRGLLVWWCLPIVLLAAQLIGLQHRTVHGPAALRSAAVVSGVSPGPALVAALPGASSDGASTGSAEAVSSAAARPAAGWALGFGHEADDADQCRLYDHATLGDAAGAADLAVALVLPTALEAPPAPTGWADRLRERQRVRGEPHAA